MINSKWMDTNHSTLWTIWQLPVHVARASTLSCSPMILFEGIVGDLSACSRLRTMVTRRAVHDAVISPVYPKNKASVLLDISQAVVAQCHYSFEFIYNCVPLANYLTPIPPKRDSKQKLFSTIFIISFFYDMIWAKNFRSSLFD